MCAYKQVSQFQSLTRRNCLPLSPVPEVSSESTDDIVKTVAKTTDVTLPDNAIDRRRRGGKVTAGGLRPAYPHQVYFLQVQRGDDEGQALSEKDGRHQDLPRLPVARPTCQVYCLHTQAVHQRVYVQSQIFVS